jgi:hypothetical protein
MPNGEPMERGIPEAQSTKEIRMRRRRQWYKCIHSSTQPIST